MLSNHRFVAFLLAFGFSVTAKYAGACPFCTALKPTFAQQRERASIVALGEVTEGEQGKTTFQIHQAILGKDLLGGQGSLMIPSRRETFKAGSLVLLITASKPKQDAAPAPLEGLSWTTIRVNETSLAYFVRCPSLREKPEKRLAYFARYLEHSDALIAEDAYQEFGHAAYDEVLKVASHFDNARLRKWVTDETISQDRKGFYAIALSMTNDPAQRAANIKLLGRLIDRPADDFRAGFGGILGSYLIAKGEAGLDRIESKYLADPHSRDGDVRSAVIALRFCFENSKKVPAARLRTAMGHLLSRAEFAPAAVIDLARWEDWKVLGRVVGLYDKAGYPQPATRRAVVGYLSACPLPAAADSLDSLRSRDAAGVAEAERHLKFFGAGEQ